jgi:hypothetical protein
MAAACRSPNRSNSSRLRLAASRVAGPGPSRTSTRASACRALARSGVGGWPSARPARRPAAAGPRWRGRSTSTSRGRRPAATRCPGHRRPRPGPGPPAGCHSRPPPAAATAGRAVGGGLLGQVQAPAGVAGGHRLGLAGRSQPLSPIGPQRLQQPKTGRVAAGGHDQGPVDQPNQPLQDLGLGQAGPPHTTSAAATVQPPENTDNRRHNRRCGSASSSQLQSMVARRVC